MSYVPKTTPFAHQVEALERSARAPFFALFLGPGTGKSKITLDEAGDLYTEGLIDALVVFAPNGVHRQWVLKEVPTHLNVPYAAGLYRSGMGKRQREAVEAVASANGVLRILCVNIEAMAHKSAVDFVTAWIKAAGRCMVAIDESQRIKTPSSKTAMNLLKLRSTKKGGLGHLIPYRRILTGTPVTVGYEDLYNQLRFLDPGILDCHTKAEFQAMYCQMAMVGGYPKIVGYRNIKAMRARLAPYVYARKRTECLDLPPQQWVTRYTELTTEQRQAYLELRDEYMTQLQSGVWVTGEQAMTRTRMLQQVVAGHVTDPETRGLGPQHRKVLELPTNRYTDAVELVQAMPGKVLVWAEEQFEIARMMRTFADAGIKAVAYYGAVSRKQRDVNLDAFMADPTIKAWVANPACGGVGLTINEASDSLYVTHGYSYEKREQSEARNHRPGQTADRVLYTDMIAKGTIEERVRRRVNSRRELAAEIENMSAEALVDVMRELLADDDEPAVFTNVSEFAVA